MEQSAVFAFISHTHGWGKKLVTINNIICIQQSSQLYPPTVLLEFYPLAAYCNEILTALNELRLCAPVALVAEVSNALHDSFVKVNKVILAFHR